MRKKYVITSIFVAILILIGIAVHAYYSKGPAPTNNSNNNSIGNMPTFTNENDLLNIGVTSEQLSNLEQTLEQYLSSIGKNTDQVHFTSITRLPTNPNATTPQSTVKFVVQLNAKDAYQASLDSFSLSEVRLYLYSLDGKTLLYDSQNIGNPNN